MSSVKKQLLVIGGASFDILHLEDQTVESIGGVGMYTAMAANRCGGAVSMLSPRPDPIPAPMQPVANQLVEWLGPPVFPDQLPGFEISYFRSGNPSVRSPESWMTGPRVPGRSIPP